MENSRKLLSDNIAYFLKKRGLIQAELAEKIGVNRSTVSGWVGAHKKPEFDNIDRMAEALNVQVYELFVDHKGNSDPFVENLDYRALIENNPDAVAILNEMKRMTKRRLRAMRIIMEELADLEKREHGF